MKTKKKGGVRYGSEHEYETGEKGFVIYEDSIIEFILLTSFYAINYSYRTGEHLCSDGVHFGEKYVDSSYDGKEIDCVKVYIKKNNEVIKVSPDVLYFGDDAKCYAYKMFYLNNHDPK